MTGQSLIWITGKKVRRYGKGVGMLTDSKYKLTVLVPGIRPQNWKRLYDSIEKTHAGSWEIIFIGPYDVPENLKGIDNITYIEDWGTPMRCMQRGLNIAKGTWITWAADDGYFLKDAINISFKMLAKANADYMTLVMGKYIEGKNDGSMSMQGDEYYMLKKHKATCMKYVPEDCFMLNVGIVARELLLEVGGWDCQFEVCPMAFNDLAIRLHNKGVKFIIQNEIMFTCSHLPGREGDHGPIHDAQIYYDEPLFRRIWESSDSKERINISLNNWEKAPERWERRFGPC